MSLFFVDSGSELSFELTKNLGIERINIDYTINGEKCEFSEDFDFDKFYSKYKKGVCLDSAKLEYQDYLNVFEPCLKQGDDVIYVCASENILSNNELEKVKEELLKKYPDRQFEIIDSKNISIGQGLVSYEMAMLYRKGDTISEIKEKSLDIVNGYATFFIVDNAQQLVKHNIVSKDSITGTALNIKSLFAVDIDGNIQLYDKVSGKKTAISKLVQICRQLGNNVADYPIGIAYSSDSAMASDLESSLKETFGSDINLIKNRISPSNALLLGSGVIALSFHMYRKIH